MPGQTEYTRSEQIRSTLWGFLGVFMGLLRAWSLGRGQKVPYPCLVALKLVAPGRTLLPYTSYAILAQEDGQAEMISSSPTMGQAVGSGRALRH